MSTQAPVVLVIDSDVEFATLLVDFLNFEGFYTFCGRSLNTAFHKVPPNELDFIVINSHLPDGEVLAWLKNAQSHISAHVILLLDQDAKEPETSVCQDLRIDATFRKPFSLRQFAHKLQATSKLITNRTECEPLTYGSLSVNVQERKVTLEGQPLDLTNSEFAILELLILKPEVLITKEYISQRAFDRPVHMKDRTIDVHISSIRRKFRERNTPIYIASLRRQGYKLCCLTDEESVGKKQSFHTLPILRCHFKATEL
ncbi:MAG: response regulator transcription factor [Sutterella wadsworthensis]|nr:response regulator transcription factor [Sutterella wadsworthensis]